MTRGRRAERQAVRSMKEMGLREPTVFAPVGEEERHYRHWIKKPLAPDINYEEQPKFDGELVLTSNGVERVNDMGRA